MSLVFVVFVKKTMNRVRTCSMVVGDPENMGLKAAALDGHTTLISLYLSRLGSLIEETKDLAAYGITFGCNLVMYMERAKCKNLR